MISRVGCDEIYTYLSEFKEYVNAKQPVDADEAYLSYNDMDPEQQDMIYEVVNIDDDRFTQELAVKAVNVKGFEAEDGEKQSIIACYSESS